MTTLLKTLIRYKAWANELTFSSISDLPSGEAEKQRQTNFGSIVHTLNHVFVVDDIFQHHLEMREHHYTARNTKESAPLAELWQKQRIMDAWWIQFVDDLTPELAADNIEFTFVGGGEGCMTREEIVMHIANHGTYHRGFVNDMMYQIPARPPANDFPVYLREIKKTVNRCEVKH